MDITCWRWTEHCFARQKYKVFSNILAFGIMPRAMTVLWHVCPRCLIRSTGLVSMQSYLRKVWEKDNWLPGIFFELTVGDLILLDRGYPAYWLFNLIMSMGADFCARVSATKWKIIRKFVNSGKREAIISLPVSTSSIEKCKELGFEISSLKLMLVRVELDTGEVEVLITSLIDKEALPYELFRGLYHLRWPVEEGCKKMKSWIEIENFSGKSVESVHQDFSAKIFAKNLTAILASTTSEDINTAYKTRKYMYQVNCAQAYYEMKRIIPALFFRSRDLVSEIIAALRQFFVQTIETLRFWSRKINT